MAKKKAFLAVRTEEYLQRELKRISEKSGISQAEILRQAIEQYIESCGEDNIFKGCIRVSLDEQDTQAMQALSKKWGMSVDEVASFLINRGLSFYRRN